MAWKLWGHLNIPEFDSVSKEISICSVSMVRKPFPQKLILRMGHGDTWTFKILIKKRKCKDHNSFLVDDHRKLSVS